MLMATSGNAQFFLSSVRIWILETTKHSSCVEGLTWPWEEPGFSTNGPHLQWVNRAFCEFESRYLHDEPATAESDFVVDPRRGSHVGVEKLGISADRLGERAFGCGRGDGESLRGRCGLFLSLVCRSTRGPGAHLRSREDRVLRQWFGGNVDFGVVL